MLEELDRRESKRMRWPNLGDGAIKLRIMRQLAPKRRVDRPIGSVQKEPRSEITKSISTQGI